MKTAHYALRLPNGFQSAFIIGELSKTAQVAGRFAIIDEFYRHEQL